MMVHVENDGVVYLFLEKFSWEFKLFFKLNLNPLAAFITFSSAYQSNHSADCSIFEWSASFNPGGLCKLP